LFAAPTVSAPKLENNQTLSAAVKALSEQPGFRAVAFEFITASPEKLVLGYSEALGAPSYIIFCTPNP
jgi:hypothetical protein